MVPIAALAVTLLSLLGAWWCRIFWVVFPRRRKVLLFVASSLCLGTYAVILFSPWAFTAPLANGVLGGLAVGGYSLLVMLATFLKPRWLFRGLAVVLLLPVLAGVVIVPLRAESRMKIEHIGGTLFVGKYSWDPGALGGPGLLWCFTTGLAFFRSSNGDYGVSFSKMVAARLRRHSLCFRRMGGMRSRGVLCTETTTGSSSTMSWRRCSEVRLC